MPRSPSHHQDSRPEIDDEFFEEIPGKAHGGNRAKRMALDLLGRWYWIALGLVIGSLGAAYYLSKAPKQYTAGSSLLIKTQTDSLMRNDQLEDVALGSSEAMNTAAMRIRRYELMERVAAREDVRSLKGLIPPKVDWRPEWLAKMLDDEEPETPVQDGAPPPPPGVLAGYLQAWVDTSITRGTRLLEIRVGHPIPEVAKALADAVAREYMAEIRDDVSAGRTSTIEVLREESESARQKLQTATTARSVYTRALAAHEALDTQEVEVARLDQRYLPAHPKMQAANAEFARLKQRFIDEFETARSSPNDATYWQGVSRQLPDPEVDRDRYLRVARQLLLARIGVLESEIESQTSVFNSMLTRIEESNINQESEETSTRINSLARVPGRASSPVASTVYTTGIGAGLAGGLVLAFLLVRLDNKFQTVAQVEQETESSVLAAVSHIPEAHLEQAARRHFRKHPEDQSDAYDDWDPLLVFRPGILNTNYAEMYRILRASISLLGDESENKISLFTSALPGEGKTATSTNFALAAAGQKRRTLLIDCDLRKPAVHKIFGMSRETPKGGITEVLAGQIAVADTVISDFPEPNLHVIFSGKRAPNPGELLDASRLKAVLDWAASNYDVIVLDTAPLLAVPDTRIIAPLVDNVCLVVRGQYVPKGAVARTLGLLEEDGTRLSGIVFNGFKEKKRLIGQNYSYGHYKMSRYGRSYQYGYGGYGSYGAYGSEEEDEPSNRRRRVGKRRRKQK